MENKTGPPTTQPRPFSGNLARISGAGDQSPSNLIFSGDHLHRSRRRIFLAGLCGLFLAALLVLGVVAIVLAFTVFRVSNPTLSMNAVYFSDVHSAGDDRLNTTVVADISVRNPNAATFRFGESVTKFYVEGGVVGLGHGAGLRVGAKKTVRMNVSASVVAVSGGGVSVSDSGSTGIVRMRSTTEVEGKVNVLGVFKRNVGVKMNCNLSFDSNRSAEVAQSKDCISNVN